MNNEGRHPPMVHRYGNKARPTAPQRLEEKCETAVTVLGWLSDTKPFDTAAGFCEATGP
jgi:hypothetical protein